MVALYGGDAQFPFDGKVLNLNANPGKRFFDLSGWKSLSNIIKEFKPDVVQANASDTLKFQICLLTTKTSNFTKPEIPKVLFMPYHNW